MKTLLTLITLSQARTAKEAGSPNPSKQNEGRRQNSNNYQTNYETYGDPHFMVQSIAAEPICFDYNPPEGTVITLLNDPVSGLLVTGKIGPKNQHNKTFIDQLYLLSPLGAQLNFNTSGVILHGLPVREQVQYETPTRMKYGDITFIEKWNPDGTHDRIIIDVANGPKFLISAKVKKGSMSFGIIDIRGVSIKSKGILGNFIRPDAYSILPRLEKSPFEHKEQALILNDHMVVNAVKRQFHKNDLCWTVEDNDVDTLLANV